MENILGKGENAGNQHFLLFPKCFQKPPFARSLNIGIQCGNEESSHIFLVEIVICEFFQFVRV